MKILHIDPDDMDNPVSGGGPVRTYEICRRLVGMGHEVTVLTPTFPGSTPEKMRAGIRYVRLGRRIGNHGSSHHLTFFFQAPRSLGDFPHDILIEDFMPPMAATFTPWFAKRPVVGSVQWFSTRAWQQQFHLPFVLGEHLLIRNYRNLIVMTERMRTNLADRLPRANICTIPNAVDDGFFALQPSFHDFILFVGRVEFRDKGLDLLLQAYAKIPVSQRLPLVVAGHGWENDKVKRFAQELGIAEWVRLVGRKSPSEVADLFSKCRFACVPSRIETFGIVIIEAMAAAKPVIVFDRWPMNEVANRQGCLLVPALNVDAYADAMASLLKADVATLRQMGERNRLHARQFSWSKSAAQQVAFYQSVLGREQ